MSEKMTKTSQGHDINLVFEKYDGITNRVSIGGDKRGYYTVVRGKTHMEAIKAVEYALEALRAHVLDLSLKDYLESDFKRIRLKNSGNDTGVSNA